MSDASVSRETAPQPVIVPPPLDPLSLADFKKGIVVPRDYFDPWLHKFDWTYHQLARGELPPPFQSLQDFQLACISSDPLLWCTAFLREPEDPDHEEPYSFWDYQIESLRYLGNVVHKDGAEVGKTREIVALCLYLACTTPNGNGLIGAPQQTHLDEIIEAMDDQINWSPDLSSFRRHRRIKDGWKKHPHHAFYFRNGFKIDFRPSGFDGQAYRGVHARTFVIKDEAAKDKNAPQWSEFWRAMKPGCIARIYSVPDGDRSCEFYKLGQRAAMNTANKEKGRAPLPEKEEVEIESFKDAGSHIKNLTFRLFHWGKHLMPHPYWSPERRLFYVDQYGGEDSPGYRHNVLGEDGDPEHTVFPWHQFRHCIKDIPEYRCLKILVDASHNEVIVRGYRCNYTVGENGPIPQIEYLIDTTYPMSTFFDLTDNSPFPSPPPLPLPASTPDSPSTCPSPSPASASSSAFDSDSPSTSTLTSTYLYSSDFTRLLKSFFPSLQAGQKRGGGDFGFSDDETELITKSVIGRRERLIARLHLKHVTYDQQCQALNALDDLYGPMEALAWGTDFGNAGSAVAHDLQGLQIYRHKEYEDRLKGFQFESTTDNVNEEGEEIIDAKTGKPSKITLKELATDILVKKMQRQELEYPPDPDIILYYTNHTVRTGGKHRIYKKEDDHLIDADRAQILAKILRADVEDLFA